MVTGVWGYAPTSKIPGPAGVAGSEICRKCGYTSYACCFLVFVPPFNTIVDVFPAGISQKHRPVVGFPGFHGTQALYLCLSVFE